MLPCWLHAVKARKTKTLSPPYHLSYLRRAGTLPEHSNVPGGVLVRRKKGGILNLYEPPHEKGADHERRSLTGAGQACIYL